VHPRRSVGPVHDGADRPCPPIRKFALRETRDQALADLPWVRRLVPAVDLREFPRERALVTARAPILDIIHRVQADRPHSAGQEAAHDDGERGNAMLSSAHPGSNRRLGALGLPRWWWNPATAQFYRAIPDLHIAGTGVENRIPGGARVRDDTLSPPGSKVTTQVEPEFVKNNDPAGANSGDHTQTPKAPWTGSGWRGDSYGGFGGGHPHNDCRQPVAASGR